MEKKTRFTLPDGKPIKGQEVEFKIRKEDWNEYQTEDGSRIKFKAVVTKIVRTERRDTEGKPIYMIQTSNVAVVSNVINPPEKN